MALNNVVASSDYECLIWGMKETGPRGGEGGECHMEEETQLKKGVLKGGRKGSVGRGSEGFWVLIAVGATYRKGRLPAADLGRTSF